MLPHSYELPAAILLVLGGALACFAGYRLFRVVLAVYGFMAGALIASSMLGVTNTIGMVAAALGGGIAGALILVFAYFVAIALVGAGLGALAVHAYWSATAPSTDPPILAVVLVSVVGAVFAMVLQRYVIIIGTAFGGAWTLIVGTLAAVGARVVASATAASDAWILYPLNPGPGERWLPLAWVGLGLIGTLVQLGLTGRKR